MKKIIDVIGLVASWLSWPLRWLVLNDTVRSRVLIFSDGKLLVLQHLIGDNKWSLPGGGTKKSETPLESAIREVKEETGIKLSNLTELGSFISKSQAITVTKVIFTCTLVDQPEVKKRFGEIAELVWIEPTTLNIQNASAGTLKAIDLWKKKP